MKIYRVLALLVLSLSLFAQTSPLARMPPVKAEPMAHFVTSGDWPLKWVEQTFTEEDQLQQIVLQNVSRRTIAGFQLGWVMFIPKGCGVTEAGVPRREIHLGPYETRRVSPGEKVAVGPYHFSSASIKTLASRAHSSAVIAQIGLYRVRYSDGGEMVSVFEQRGAFGPEPSAYPCESNKVENPDTLPTFTSPDGAFRFAYSELLVHCTESKHQSLWWEPASSCEAYFPVCDDHMSQGSRTVACFAYPREKFKDSPTFEAAAFSVAEIEGANNEKECLDGSPDWNVDPRGSGGNKVINGVEFRMFRLTDAGMSKALLSQVYRNFHQNKCYELSFRMAMANPAVFDPGSINEFTEEDRNEVEKRLHQALESFTFLK